MEKLLLILLVGVIGQGGRHEKILNYKITDSSEPRYEQSVVTVRKLSDSTQVYIHRSWCDYRINPIDKIIFCNISPHQGVFGMKLGCRVKLSTTQLQINFDNTVKSPIILTLKR